jgi:hypothetical protein
MISINKNNKSIVREFMTVNKLSDAQYGKYISEEYININSNRTLLLTAMLENNGFANSALLLCAYMGRKVLDKIKIFKERVIMDGFYLEEIPEEYQLDDPSIVIDAVSQSGRVLSRVKNKTFNICLAAVKKYAWALEYIKDILDRFEAEQIYQICKTAVSKQGLTIKYIFPENKIKYNLSHEKNINICMLAVKNNGLALDFVPYNLRENNETLCLEAVKQNSKAINYVPNNKLWTEKIEDVAFLQGEKEIKDIAAGKLKPFYIGESVEYIVIEKEKKTIIFNIPDSVKEQLRGNYLIIGPVGKKKYPFVIEKEFMKDTGLTKLFIQKGVEEIKERAFIGNNFSEIYFSHFPQMQEDSFDVDIVSSIPEDFKNRDPRPGKIYLFKFLERTFLETDEAEAIAN